MIWLSYTWVFSFIAVFSSFSFCIYIFCRSVRFLICILLILSKVTLDCFFVNYSFFVFLITFLTKEKNASIKVKSQLKDQLQWRFNYVKSTQTPYVYCY